MDNATITLSIPTDAITVAAPLPELLSQHNVLAIAGVPPRAFLDLLRRSGFPLAVTKLGKTRLVDRAAFVSWLKSGATLPTVEAMSPANEVDPVTALAGKMGLDVHRER